MAAVYDVSTDGNGFIKGNISIKTDYINGYWDVVCYETEREGEINTLTPLFESTGIKIDH